MRRLPGGRAQGEQMRGYAPLATSNEDSSKAGNGHCLWRGKQFSVFPAVRLIFRNNNQQHVGTRRMASLPPTVEHGSAGDVAGVVWAHKIGGRMATVELRLCPFPGQEKERIAR